MWNFINITIDMELLRFVLTSYPLHLIQTHPMTLSDVRVEQKPNFRLLDIM
jgi:hypothetical protein